MNKLLSHNYNSNLKGLSYYKDELTKNNNLILPLEQEEKLLEELYQTDIGKFLLANRGFNGYWTSYIILNNVDATKTEFEQWLLNRAPIILATRERFHIFKREIQNRLKNNISIASVPCGLMDDVLSIDYSNVYNAKLCGIDLDPMSLELAAKNAMDCGNKNISFLHKDAWQLNIDQEHDLLISNGLNIYESNKDKVLELYKMFYNALKQNGILITSFLTPPPNLCNNSPWMPNNAEDVLMQSALFKDIIKANWQTFNTSDEVAEQLKSVGFTDVDFIYDSQKMFPTAIAKKL